MNKSNHLRAIRTACVLVLAWAAVLPARDHKADKLFKAGEKAESLKQYDQAVDFYQRALAMDPSEPEYVLAVRRARFEAGQKHVENGRKLRQQGQLEAAASEFQQAILQDPSSSIAIEEWNRTTAMIDAEKKSGVKLTGTARGLTPAQREQRSEDELISSMEPPPQLEPISREVKVLKMNNQPPKVLYETVGKLAGINVIFDPTYSPPGEKRFNLDLNNEGLEQAFDIIAMLTHTWWKPVSSNTIFVTDDNPTKRREYEDDVVKVFYLKNPTSVQEFQEINTAVRTITEIRRVFTYSAQRAIVVRGPADAVALAGKIIHDLDKPKPEVVVDVIVMETDSDRTSDIAATLVSGGTNGISLPVGFAPRASLTIPTGTTSDTTTDTTSTSTAVSLNNLKRVSLGDFYTTLPGALLSLVMKDTSTRILQSPEVRASDGQKVTLKIGDKIPYASGSFQPGVGTVGVSPLVSTQFQFADVGVNVDMTPTVHGDDEVTLKLNVTISSVAQYVTIGGISQPVIGQRSTETEVRLRDGEVNILGGLSQFQNAKTLSGIPGLVNIPVLGGILGGEQSKDNSRQQLLIAVIPHIVRTPDITAENLRGVDSGTDQEIHLNYAPQPLPAQTTISPPVAPGPEGPAPQMPAPAVGHPAIPGVPNPTGSPMLSFLPSTVASRLSGGVTVSLDLTNGADIAAASPIKIKFDPKILRLMDVTAGRLLGRDGQTVNLIKDIRNDAGEAEVMISRAPGKGGISGSGPLATFTFVAIGKGATTVTVTDADLKNAHAQQVVVARPELRVDVQ
jgi:general secretion pathway protein D